MEHSHGKSIQYIIDTAIEVIEYVATIDVLGTVLTIARYVKSTGKEIRFSTEDR